MTTFGYTLMCEQRDPRSLVRDAVEAEAAGFDFAVISDHFHPWLEHQGQAAFAWTVLGALAERTERMDLLTMVTCPIVRYHPAIIAQAAATMGVMSAGRFSLGLGAGENLNEHVVGRGWPSASVRHEMLEEAIDIIRLLWQGGFQRYDGKHLQLDDARLYTLPEEPPKLWVASGGAEASKLAAAKADGLIAVEPRPELITAYTDAGGSGPKWGQVMFAWAADEDTAKKTAWDYVRFGVAGWKVMSELPNPVNFEAATEKVRPEDICETVACGPDPETGVALIEKFVAAGYTHIAVLQAGEDQAGFMKFWTEELAPRLTA
jgi:G6PDH family F420-dependent oxidoreductase